MGEQRTALVTGANRGIGFEVCRQLATRGLTVFLTARDASKAQVAVSKLGEAGSIEPLAMDVSDPGSIEKAAAVGVEPHSKPFPASLESKYLVNPLRDRRGLKPRRPNLTVLEVAFIFFVSPDRYSQNRQLRVDQKVCEHLGPASSKPLLVPLC